MIIDYMTEGDADMIERSRAKMREERTTEGEVGFSMPSPT